MDLNIIFSKTPKASRAPLPWVGGLSAQFKQVLSHVDGKQSAEEILRKSGKLSSNELHKILLKLEEDGYIKRVLNQQAEPDWLKDVSSYSINANNNYSIAVEEIDAAELSFDAKNFNTGTAAELEEVPEQNQHLEAKVAVEPDVARRAQEVKAIKAKREAERKAQAEAAEKARLEAAEQAKRIAEAGAKARQEVERIEREKAEAAAKVKAEEASLQAEAERKAKVEAEEKARVEAERKAQAEAAEQARLQQERIAREEAEAQARIERERIEAIARAKAEEEARLQAEVERKAQAEAEEKARLEAERIAREEAEERARLEAERIAREKAEAIARAKAEEEARLQVEAERKAKAEAEEKARVEAERKAQAEAAEQARLERERIAREQARIELERKTQEELAAKAKLEAEEQARLNAERIEREKAEAIAQAKAEEEARLQAEAELKAKAEAEEKARAEAERIAQVEAAEQKLREAQRLAREEEKARREAEEKAQAEAEKAAREEAKRLAKEEKAAKAKLKAEEKARAKEMRSPIMLNKMGAKLIKPLLVAIPLVVILMVGLIHLVNLSMLIEPIEKMATESVGEPVKVREVRASLFPQPHLVLTDVAVGGNADIKIGSVNIMSAVSMLFNDVKVLKSIDINTVTLTPADFGRQAQWVNNAAKSGKLKIEHVTLKQISFKVSDLEPETFNGKVALTPSGELNNVELVNASGNLTLLLTPQNGSAAVTLTASDWQSPLFEKLAFDEVTAKGIISQNKISFSQIEAKAFGGTIKAQGELNWDGRLSASGNFELIKMTLPRVLSVYESDASVDGTLNATAAFASSADQASGLVAAAEVDADFEVLTGKVNGIALSHALIAGPTSKPSPDADFTRFDTLTGNLQFKDGQYKYKQFALKTEQFRARGNFNIEPDKTVSGKVSAELTSTSQRRQASFTVSGAVADVKFK
jgi:hypothetical protein